MLLAWIKNIVLFILFSSLVFFLLPDEKYRKYMQTAVGFVLAIIVLTPVLSAGGLNDILSFDYYYESVAGAPGNGDVTYYTDVMETMIKDHCAIHSNWTVRWRSPLMRITRSQRLMLRSEN